MTVTRYTDGGPEGWMQSPTGEFVKYEDYERLRSGILEIAESRPMSAMTRRALRELVGAPEPQSDGT